MTVSKPAQDLLHRRGFLAHTGSGLGGIALASLLSEERLLAEPQTVASVQPKIDPANPYAARKSHFKPKAKNVVVVFVSGALSHVDTFEHKPELEKFDGKPMPGSADLVTFQGENGNLTKPLWKFLPRGESGKLTSELLPNLGALADEMCFVHSLTSKTNTHGPGENFMSTGFNIDGFPSLGAWTTYALGSENANLPAFVAIPDPRGLPQAAGNNWGSGFLPASFQGTAFNTSQRIRYLQPPEAVGKEADAATAAFLKRQNARHLETFPGDSQLAARIASYELAARMQKSIPEVTNIESETKATLKFYGADSPNKTKSAYARNCILARRLIESGVRFVQLFNGAYAMGEGVGNWDGHKQIAKQYPGHAEIFDQPTAALFQDMRQRGLLEDTLFVICTEFGRMPTFQKGASGRDHNPAGFTAILAGAGVKSPFTYGATDAFGWKAEQNPTSVYDFHATILHLLGLNHERLTFYHNGIQRRLTDVHGHVLKQLLA